LGKKSKKVLYELQENETIASCLDRMKKDGYMPVRRMEKPIFEEKEINGKKEYVPVKQQIVFEGKVSKYEHFNDKNSKHSIFRLTFFWFGCYY